MKFVVFGVEGRLGLLENDRILDLARAARTSLQNQASRIAGSAEQTLASLHALIEAGRRGLDLVQAIAEEARRSGVQELYTPLSTAQLQAPWPGQRLVLGGANNADHIADCFNNMGSPTTQEQVHANTRKGPPSAFWAIARPIMGPGAMIEIPARANGLFDYEGEPAIVLGKRGKDIKAADAQSYIWGVTLAIDWSIREEAWPPKPPGPLFQVKNFDCSKSIGPCIAVDEVGIESLQVETLVNGEVRQSFGTQDMIFSFSEFLEFLSQDLTFFPGDIISGGTGPGTAVDTTVPNRDGSWPRTRFLKAGDVVEVRSPAVGSLVGHVITKRAAG